MGNIITGIEAVKKAKSLLDMDESRIFVNVIVDNTNITIYEFLDNYYMAVVNADKIYLSAFEKITKEEADRIRFNVKSSVYKNKEVQFGGF